jgi:hypothetical protein
MASVADILHSMAEILRSAGVFDGVLGGIVASVLIWIFVSITKAIRDHNRFELFTGQYEVYRDNEKVGSEKIIIKRLRGNVILAKNKDDKELWESHIELDEKVPILGNGVYQYLTAKKWGTHRITKSSIDGDILVWVGNPARETPDYKVIWRRKLKSSDKMSRE